MKKIVQHTLAALLMVSSLSAFAASSSDTQTITTIKSNLKKNLPDLVIDKVIPTRFSGVYEVDSGRKVLYVDSTGNLALIGNMFDLTNKVSLTEQRTNELNVIDWKKIPTDIAIRRVKGNGSNQIAVFTDPDCPFCKRMEAETLSKLTDVTIYYFMFPLEIHPHAASDSRRILCSENPESSMIAFMVKDAKLTKNESCTNAANLAKMMDVGSNLIQVTGTPTVVLPNGRIVSGLVPADYLSRMIDANRVGGESAISASK